MGFWKSVGGVLVSVGKAVVNASKEAESLSMEWSGKSDEFLVQQYKKSSGAKRLAAAAVFKRRYPDEGVRKKAFQNALRS